MRLRTILADYPKSFLDALEKKGISAPEDLIFPKSDLELFHELASVDMISYQDLCNAREKVTRTIAAKGHTARFLLLDATGPSRATPWMTGVSELDDLLQACNGVVEVAGGKRSGKTVLRRFPYPQ